MISKHILPITFLNEPGFLFLRSQIASLIFYAVKLRHLHTIQLQTILFRTVQLNINTVFFLFLQKITYTV